MTFAEKLDILMSLTDVSSAALARVLHVDRSTVSRFRSGTRGLPKLEVIRRMAEYLAANAGETYKLNTIAELTGIPPFRQLPGVSQLTEIIYTWLISDKEKPPGAVDNLLKSISMYVREDDVGSGAVSFAANSSETAAADTDYYAVAAGAASVGTAKTAGTANAGTPAGAAVPDLTDQESFFIVYHGNRGKQQATLDFLSFVLQQGEPCLVRIFSDEDLSWLIDDAAFSRHVTDQLRLQADLGCHFERIQLLNTQLEYTLRSIERWLPLLLNGVVKQFFYPYARDGLHRRTIFVVPGKIALFSTSVAGQLESLETVLTTEKSVVANHNKSFDLILERCRQAMVVYPAERPAALFACLTNCAALAANGIYKSGALSAATIPPQLAERITAEGSAVARHMGAAFRKRFEARTQVLQKHVIIDIMYLQPASRVLAGQAEIISTGLLPDGPLYYTPAEYVAHIEQILFFLEHYPNYRVVLTDDPLWNNIIVYVKEGAHALLIKDSVPNAVFEITEQTMSDSIWDYLQRIAANEVRLGARKKAITRLRQQAAHLRSLMQQDSLKD